MPSNHPQRVFRQAATPPPDNQRKVQSEFVISFEVGNHCVTGAVLTHDVM